MMQVVFLPGYLLVPLFCGLWFFFQMGAALLCFKLPDRVFQRDGWLYKTRGFEREGELYQKLFRIRSWKQLLPDGGALFKGGYAKKHLRDRSRENLGRFLTESRRAELTHWLAILPFWVFGFFAPPRVVPIMLCYALAVNLPCILAQRYNRPRIQKLYTRMTVS